MLFNPSHKQFRSRSGYRYCESNSRGREYQGPLQFERIRATETDPPAGVNSLPTSRSEAPTSELEFPLRQALRLTRFAARRARSPRNHRGIL